MVRAREAQVGNPDAEPFLNEARTILRSYGFRTGALGTEESVRAIADPARRMELVRGDSNTEITQLQRSADVALDTEFTELGERYGVFTEGQVTRTLPNGTTRTIDVDYTTDVAQRAGNVNVSEGEALAKTDWRVYRTALNAGFATNDLGGFTINGAWRPFAGLATTVGALPNPGTEPHMRGLGLDINELTDVNGNTTPILNTQVGAAQPAIVQQFSVNLRQQAGVSQVIQPWMTYGVNLNNLPTAPRPGMGNGFVQNALTQTLEYEHRHHLHISLRP